MTIYFVKSQLSDSIKIGYTERGVEERVKEFALPGCEVIAIIPGGRAKEKELHRRFAHLRIGDSEWFRNGEPLKSYLAGLQGSSGARLFAWVWERGLFILLMLPFCICILCAIWSVVKEILEI